MLLKFKGRHGETVWIDSHRIVKANTSADPLEEGLLWITVSYGQGAKTFAVMATEEEFDTALVDSVGLSAAPSSTIVSAPAQWVEGRFGG